MDARTIQRRLDERGIAWQRGLSANELMRVEAALGFAVPPDLCDLLALAVPSGPDFTPWRNLDEVHRRSAAPREALVAHLEANDQVWYPAWGRRPDSADARRAFVMNAPRLVPLGGAHFIAASPASAGNPVFSITFAACPAEIVVRDNNLGAYLMSDTPSGDTATARHIRVWSDMLYAPPPTVDEAVIAKLREAGET